MRASLRRSLPLPVSFESASDDSTIGFGIGRRPGRGRTCNPRDRLPFRCRMPTPFSPRAAVPAAQLSPPSVRSSHSPRLSFTAISISCSEPRYRSVVWIEECPSRNLICSRSPPLFRHSLAQVLRRSWAPKRSIPIRFDDCSTTDQTAQALRLIENHCSRRLADV
jgi:hypothetical protein